MLQPARVEKLNVMKQLLVLLPLMCGCVGEQTRAVFTVRSASSAVEVTAVDHAAEHEANLQQALDYSVRAQEAKDALEWKASEHANTPALAALPTQSCAEFNLDTDTCDHL